MKRMSDCNLSHWERIKLDNTGEIIFEEYCVKNSIEYHKFGFDKKEDITKFNEINPFIRSLPDYLVEGSKGKSYIQVKGTNKIKLEDIIKYSWFEQFGSVYVAFCFRNNGIDKVTILSLSNVKEKLTGLILKEYVNDHNQYFELVI